MKFSEQNQTAKRIVYLLGAGATQAEVLYKGGEIVNLMMRSTDKLGDGVCSRIIRIAQSDGGLREIVEQNVEDEDIDIEKFISLLANTGIRKYIKAAEKFRELYYEDILKNLYKADLLDEPELARGLLELHNNAKVREKEKLVGIISLNHDNLMQVASQRVFGGINLGFKFKSRFFTSNKDLPYILKLHGSFNWFKGIPIKVEKLIPTSKYSDRILWIPPTILKESRNYPYNRLMSIAYELLTNCDILRVVGCSLSQNDWNVIGVLFNAQYSKHLYKKKAFKIELIISPRAGEEVAKECSYLKNITLIQDLKDGEEFENLKEKLKEREEEGVLPENFYHFWLKTKAKFHLENGEIGDNIGATLGEIMEENP